MDVQDRIDPHNIPKEDKSQITFAKTNNDEHENIEWIELLHKSLLSRGRVVEIFR